MIQITNIEDLAGKVIKRVLTGPHEDDTYGERTNCAVFLFEDKTYCVVTPMNWDDGDEVTFQDDVRTWFKQRNLENY